MNKFKRFRQLVHGIVGILSLIISLSNSGRAMAAQNNADVLVTMVADKHQVRFGENVTYTVTATNLGSDAALFVDVIHTLSDQFNVVSMNCDRGISPDGPFCEYSILEPGESVVSTLVATPKPDAQNRERKAISAANIVFETADTVDSDSNNNSAAVMIMLIGKLNHP